MTKARTQEARHLSDRHQRTEHLKTRPPKNLSAPEPEHPVTQEPDHLSNLAERTFVWLGGAVFVGSLAACVLVYTVRWSTPGHPWTATALATNVLLFGIFAFHHSLLARESVKGRIERIVPRRMLRSVYVWTASMLLLLVLAAWQPVGAEIYRATGVAPLAMAAVQLSGLWLIARAAATIDPLELAGIHRPASREALQITGPYRFVRHPLYLGWILAVFGAAHMTGDRLAFAVITTAYLLFAIPWEERSLLRAFGDQYRLYRQQVRWRVVPWIY
jgi:protein-S-isoprenylcysteine O-methyltransferase Ste14